MAGRVEIALDKADERVAKLRRYMLMICFFFFQAEDGIRDVAVTGVQTCALPISSKECRNPGLVRDPGLSLHSLRVLVGSALVKNQLCGVAMAIRYERDLGIDDLGDKNHDRLRGIFRPIPARLPGS